MGDLPNERFYEAWVDAIYGAATRESAAHRLRACVEEAILGPFRPTVVARPISSQEAET